MRRFVIVLTLFLIGLIGTGAAPGLVATVAIAQDAAAGPDYAAWQELAGRAESAIEEAGASTGALEDLRAELVGWREKFSAAQASNNSRITTLRDQISALGPVPESGVQEPQDIAQRRSELQSQLSRLEAPRLKAEEAYQRADGLVKEIDTIIRERQTQRLLKLGPSPLNPIHWSTAISDLGHSLEAITEEARASWASPAQQTAFRENLPVTGFFFLVALVLLARGRSWMERLTRFVQRESKDVRYRGLQGFVVSLGQVVLPVVGIVMLTTALSTTHLFGIRGQIVLNNLPEVGLSFFGARWLTLRLFPDDVARGSLLGLPLAKRAELRLYGGLLGLLFGLSILLIRLAENDDYSEASNAVLTFPVLCVTGLILFRLGLILWRNQSVAETGTDEESVTRLRARMGGLLGRGLAALGISGPLIGAVGYNNAAMFFIYPSVVSIGLIGLLLVLQGVILDAYGALTKKSQEETREALAPVLIGFVLVMLSLPLFALFWGARVADLTELWTSFQQGFTVAGVTISPSVFLTLAVVFAIGYSVTRLLQSGLRTTVLPKTKIDAGGRTAILSGIGYVGIFLSAILAITSAGIDLSSLAIVAGALSVGIGFGLQNIVSNFVSGIILLIERPIAEGDWIEVGGQSGYVRDISVRSTRIETFDRTDVIVPNADLVSGVVVNWTRGNLIGRVKVPVGVAYGTDTRKVEKILRDIAEDHPLVSLNPVPTVIFMGFGADSLDFEIRAILRDVNFVLSVRSDMNHEIAKRFADEGIEIPFAQRDVWLRNPEALHSTPAKAVDTSAKGDEKESKS
ncbi:MAG: DUF3772 domain-containing protein [Paracoccaceae bacterium]